MKRLSWLPTAEEDIQMSLPVLCKLSAGLTAIKVTQEIDIQLKKYKYIYINIIIVTSIVGGDYC